ncbi:MAG: type I CRISPR-associated protein Cas7 [Bacteroidales bacterium]|nr:type I CRISPR-associated protein Cas7 [Bacteroidales bacterium]
MTTFKNRVFGCVIVKSINSNYNADFSHQPRTLPNGVVYATDKALKFAIRHYIRNTYTDITNERNSQQKVFYYTRKNENGNPLTLDQTYKTLFGDFPTKEIEKEKKKKDVGTEKSKEKIIDKNALRNNLLSCIDVRLFGCTYAGETNISIHGTTQPNHGVNIWRENNIFSEQIKSSFADGEDAEMTTLGRQSKLQEGHYLHHFSVNPKNIESAFHSLSDDDIEKLKEALRKGVTYYDSASKAGTDNEFLLWVKLDENSKTVLPNFRNLVLLDKKDGKIEIDLSGFTKVFNKNKEQIKEVEIYYLPESIKITDEPAEKTKKFDLTSGTEI